MAHSIWILINALVILGTAVYIWLFHPHPYEVIRSGQFASQAAILFFFVNINLYFILLVIRKSKEKQVRMKLTRLARVLMRWHIRIAIIGTALILIHAGIMLTQLGSYLGFIHPKMLTGYAAFLFLCVTLIAGYMRSRRASGFRRRFHLTIAFLFGAAFMIHLFMR